MCACICVGVRPVVGQTAFYFIFLHDPFSHVSVLPLLFALPSNYIFFYVIVIALAFCPN